MFLNLSLWGANGGVIPPPFYSDLIQLLSGVDGDELIDSLSPQIITPVPDVVQVPALEMTGAADSYVITPDYPKAGSSVEFDFRADSATVGRQFGSSDGSSHRFYIAAGFGGWTLGWGSTFSSGAIGATSGVKYKCELYGGRLYANGVEVADKTGTFTGQSTQPLWIGAQNNSGALFGADKNTTHGYKFRENTPIDVIIYAGDSNSSGRPDSWGTLPADEQAEQVAFYSYDVDSYGISDEENLAPIQEVDGWGCEVPAGADIRSANGRYTAFLKVSQGGSRCALSWQKGGAEYNRLVARYNQFMTDLEARGFVVTVKQFWWNNGANDATSPSQAPQYQANFNQFWSDLTTDTTIPSNTTIVMAAIQKDTSVIACPYTSTVVEQHALLGEQDGIILINTDDIALGPDDIHWNEVGIQTLGALFAQAYLADNSAELAWDTQTVFCETSGTTCHDVTGNENHVTLQAGVGWTTDDGVTSWSLTKGFRLSGAVEIPALIDGSAAADGNPLTDIGTDISGAMANRATCKYVQSDTDMLPAVLWSDDGVSFDQRTFAELQAFISGEDNSWIKWQLGTAGNCEIKEICQYGFAFAPTAAQYAALVNHFTQGICGGGVVPFSNLDFSDPDNSHWF